jgi:hypothetical protein
MESSSWQSFKIFSPLTHESKVVPVWGKFVMLLQTSFGVTNRPLAEVGFLYPKFPAGTGSQSDERTDVEFYP